MAPEQFNFTKLEDWPDWWQCFSKYHVAMKLNKEPPEVQVSLLIYSMGQEAEQVYTSFDFREEEEANDYDNVLELFNEHFMPKRNVIHVRARFHSWTQMADDSV